MLFTFVFFWGATITWHHTYCFQNSPMSSNGFVSSAASPFLSASLWSATELCTAARRAASSVTRCSAPSSTCRHTNALCTTHRNLVSTGHGRTVIELMDVGGSVLQVSEWLYSLRGLFCRGYVSLSCIGGSSAGNRTTVQRLWNHDLALAKRWF